jgi:hypothetical protein
MTRVESRFIFHTISWSRRHGIPSIVDNQRNSGESFLREPENDFLTSVIGVQNLVSDLIRYGFSGSPSSTYGPSSLQGRRTNSLSLRLSYWMIPAAQNHSTWIATTKHILIRRS